MKRGLVLGKFMPVHNGHVRLINYALSVCDELIVWICVSDLETMSGEIRFQWMKEIYKHNIRVVPVLFKYKEDNLPNTSVSSRGVSRVWANEIRHNLPDIDVFISSEKYGDYVAEFLGIEHRFYPVSKTVSATEIRTSPYLFWNEIPDPVKPYYFKKVCLLGTESTGKSTLTQMLANYFHGDCILEVGRDVVDNSNECEYEDLKVIAREHALAIRKKEILKNKILFVDTDIHITKSYAQFLFSRELTVESWIKEANQCDLYLYLDNDAPFVQDGTRLSIENRNRLNFSHKRILKESNITYELITGSWENRFKQCVEAVEKIFK